MTTKRCRNEFDDEASAFNNNGKRARISFAAVIREAMVAKSLQNLVVMLEPTLRKVIKEEVENALRKTFNSLHQSSGPLASATTSWQPPPPPPHGLQVIEADSDGTPSPSVLSPTSRSTLRLAFVENPPKKIFTNMKIQDREGFALQLQLVDDSSSTDGAAALRYNLPSSLKFDLVMVDGDFPGSGKDDWTAEEFSRSVLKERQGRRPLLTGEVNNVVMRDGKTVTLEEMVITDNSSWIRSRNFRIGARVAPECCEAAGIRIKEAITETFVVKDHRGELYKKSYPPMLTDEVWRLEKIGKEGKFHKRLSDNGINNVQDFLKMHAVDPTKLRNIMGQGMSEKMWESTVNHAKTCDLGSKLYMHRDARATVLLNPVCGVEGAVVDDARYGAGDTFFGPHKTHVERLIVDAYTRWEELPEVDRAAMLPQDPTTTMMFQQPLILPASQQDSPTAGFTNDVMVPSGYHHQATPTLGPSPSFDFDIIGSIAETVHFDVFGAAGAENMAAAFLQQYPVNYQTPMMQQPGINLYNTHELSSDEEDSSISQQGGPYYHA